MLILLWVTIVDKWAASTNLSECQSVKWSKMVPYGSRFHSKLLQPWKKVQLEVQIDRVFILIECDLVSCRSKDFSRTEIWESVPKYDQLVILKAYNKSVDEDKWRSTADWRTFALIPNIENRGRQCGNNKSTIGWRNTSTSQGLRSRNNERRDRETETETEVQSCNYIISNYKEWRQHHHELDYKAQL